MAKRATALVGLLMLAILSGACFFGVTSYQAPDGSTVYVGVVQNDGGALSNPVVQGTFFDAQGNVITTATGSTCRGLPPKGVSAFQVTLPPGTAMPARAEWKLSGTAGDPGLADGLTAQLFGTAPPIPGTSTGSVLGEITNNSANQYLTGYVCVAWVNAAGNVIRVAQGDAAALRFAPGQSQPFAIQATVPPEATGVLYFLDAVRGDAAHPLPSVIDLPNSVFQHAKQTAGPVTGGSFYLGSGEVHNTGSSPFFASLSAVTRDATGNPTGASSSVGLCDVPAFPGGYTYSGYVFASSDPTTPAVNLKLEGEQISGWMSLSPTGITNSAGASGLQHVAGTITNTTTQTLTVVRACAALYDATGTVVGIFPANVVVPAGGLAPNATVALSADVPTFGVVATAKAIAAGRP
jgi:hypothetical protein